LKHGWKKFSRLARTLFLAGLVVTMIVAPAFVAQTLKAQATKTASPQANELALAGLHPGKDGLGQARKLYGAMRQMPAPDNDGKNVLIWENPCRKETLRVEADDSGVIQFVTVQAEEHPGECAGKVTTDGRGDRWRTGHGLAIGDDKAHVIQIYGEPGTDGPSTGGHREGELLYYAFDWAGSDVPQVMEVYCDRETNRVMEITLSNPSL
jgi:hypothetical protein